MSETYSRIGSLSIKKEATTNTAVIPDTFMPINDESIVDDFSYTPSVPISGNRAINQRAIDNKLPAPNGTINLNVEPKTFGHILNGMGSVTSGTWLKISNISGGPFTQGESLSFAPSSATATASYIGDDFILLTSITGTPTTSDTITGGTSSATADVDEYNATVFGHATKFPVDASITYSLQRNYSDRAVRYMGVRFHGIDAFGQADNIITAGVQMMAQSMFRHARVTDVTTAAAGSQTITVDSTHGLVASDTIKLYRPSTGAFLDFSAASVKTHTVDAVTNQTAFTITALETSTAVGDLIVLAPQTPSYSIAEEFPWVGGATASMGDETDSLSTVCLEDFSMSATNEFEERHCVNGTDLKEKYPNSIVQKGFIASGSFSLINDDEDFIRHARLNTAQSVKINFQGAQIGSTGLNHALEVLYSEVQFDAYQLNLSADELVNEEVPFSSFYSDDAGYSVQILLKNDVSSY